MLVVSKTRGNVTRQWGLPYPPVWHILRTVALFVVAVNIVAAVADWSSWAGFVAAWVTVPAVMASHGIPLTIRV